MTNHEYSDMIMEALDTTKMNAQIAPKINNFDQ